MMEIFSKTWEIFSKTMEIFQKTWEFFSEQRRFIPKPRTIEQAAWSIPLQYFVRITSPHGKPGKEARKHSLKKCYNPLSSRGRAPAHPAIYAFLLSQPSQISA
jgi:hypothetical protein